MPAESLNF